MNVLTYAKGVFDLTKWFLVAAFILVLLNFVVVTVYFVSGPSMEPNLPDGAAVLVNRLVYRGSDPHRGDLVVVRYPGDPEETYYVKRVVALPGEKVTIRDGKLYIDDQLLNEPYLSGVVTEPSLSVTVPAEQFYTLGDNRPLSNDSRFFGAVEKRFLLGRVELTLLPSLQLYPEVIY